MVAGSLIFPDSRLPPERKEWVDMDFWINFWTFLLFASIAVFVVLAVVVAVGGFFDIRSLFKSLKESANKEDFDD